MFEKLLGNGAFMGELLTQRGKVIYISDESKRIRNLSEISAPLSADDIVDAAEEYDSEGDAYPFKSSIDYDVVVGDQRYPPKALLGIALSKYYGVQILPEHFIGGASSSCFSILNKLKFTILPKESVKRCEETFQFDGFEEGSTYTKLEAFRRAGVRVPNQARDIPGPTRFMNCVVLFVTLEKANKALAHKYNDQFLLGGLMFQWESQNRNTVSTPHMKMILEGEPVVLFARIHEKVGGKSQPFVYVGQLKYIQHKCNPTPTRPIEVVFELSNYRADASGELLNLYEWLPGEDSDLKHLDINCTELEQTAAPKRASKPKKVSSKKAPRKVDWADIDERNRDLGLIGEKLVLEYEVKRLKSLGLGEQANRVKHVAVDDDTAGYDILSFDEYGKEIYIEVKTTTQSMSTPFYISRNEVEVSREKGEQYWIYRVYSVCASSQKALFYSLQGDVESHFEIVPYGYKAYRK
ncbi:DUF3883 domain-containing protein [Pseudoalteromonas sp. ACER1]|jgi:hypothetical protein|uniref:DUF3427 domain-containing protein n=1 Tax=unclassified Pseudoalteromonas TaxID=194690 RepID=UPI001F1D655C|nr:MULTISPECIES: DUF3427 domain-containing protein [unclassified Pseudoalteromonas]MCF2849178.1 DUF3883 domain-containing protein [Pseudoalteromonas sp. PAST1]MCO7212652.1 DUF3883 domain-containing protein [Pseudoalteromonas sp. ACER1]